MFKKISGKSIPVKSKDNVFMSKGGFMNFFRSKKTDSDPDRLDWVMRCPRCGIEMRKVTREGITIDVCDRCGGMWLDKGEMDSLNKLSWSAKYPSKTSSVKNISSRQSKQKEKRK